jgi:hypothetical protein
VCLIGLGCGGSLPQAEKHEANASYQHLQIIRSAYLRAISELGRPPQNEQELIPYIRYKGEGGPETVLRSPTDGLPYKILWGVAQEDIIQPGERGYPVLAYEQQGKDGIRLVLESKTITQMTEEQLKNAPFPPGHQPPS